MRTLQNDLGVLAESFDAVRALSCPPTSVVGGAARFIVELRAGCKWSKSRQDFDSNE